MKIQIDFKKNDKIELLKNKTGNYIIEIYTINQVLITKFTINKGKIEMNLPIIPLYFNNNIYFRLYWNANESIYLEKMSNDNISIYDAIIRAKK